MRLFAPRLTRLCLLLTCCGLMAACTDVNVGSPQPSFEAVQTLNASRAAPITVGTFGPGPSLPPEANQSLGVRAVTLRPPEGRSFSQYLGDLLQADLTASGKTATDAPLVVSGQLDHNELNAGSFVTNDAHITATFVVTRRTDNTVVYQKQLDVAEQWPSAFVGAEAIPTAINHYTSLYKTLLNKLFLDSEFQISTQAVEAVSTTGQ